MANTLEELRKENPALAEQLMAEAGKSVSIAASAGMKAEEAASALSAGTAVATAAPTATEPKAQEAQTDPIQAERQRLQDIDALASLYDTETIRAAKYGPDACTAQEMVYRAAQKAAQQGKSYMGALERDTRASGAQGVTAATSGSAPGDEGVLTPQQLMAKGRADAKALKESEKEEK